jgi:hypothetical protein
MARSLARKKREILPAARTGKHAEAVELALSGVHVLKGSGGWSVAKPSPQPFTRTFRDKEAAIARAREIAEASNTTLYIHERDGKIEKQRAAKPKS